ncbi:hypothetical protein NC653_023772 [Populus alba x Populus x berolinensis]|uniref:Uncharacterized protein n=1 Tax=Populus alba x Populus x berolinensis TaxID=444605 RepID=A0AAD6MI16_9ROSI|nr:hypothetical protein NC653_023772 [Populus alba x Populus x berolinensis]
MRVLTKAEFSREMRELEEVKGKSLSGFQVSKAENGSKTIPPRRLLKKLGTIAIFFFRESISAGLLLIF